MGHETSTSLATPAQIVTTRIYEAPRELVWRVFTESGHVEQWWGPVGFRTTTQAMDVRPGGHWLHVMHGPDGRDDPNRVVYTRVEPPALLAWAHDDGASAEPLFHAVVTFEDLGGRTLVTLRHLFASTEARDANIRTYGSVQGAIDTTERLASYLHALPGERDFVLAREFEVARERLWAAWTEPGRLARWWGPAVFANTVCEADVKVGGRYRITMTGPFPGPGDTDYPVEGVYLEVVAPERLVMTMDCSGHPPFWHDLVKPGRAADETNPAGTMVCTVIFERLEPARTRLVIRERMVSPEVLASMQRMGMGEGWAQSLDRLAAEAGR